MPSIKINYFLQKYKSTLPYNSTYSIIFPKKEVKRAKIIKRFSKKKSVEWSGKDLLYMTQMGIFKRYEQSILKPMQSFSTFSVSPGLSTPFQYVQDVFSWKTSQCNITLTFARKSKDSCHIRPQRKPHISMVYNWIWSICFCFLLVIR